MLMKNQFAKFARFIVVVEAESLARATRTPLVSYIWVAAELQPTLLLLRSLPMSAAPTAMASSAPETAAVGASESPAMEAATVVAARGAAAPVEEAGITMRIRATKSSIPMIGPRRSGGVGRTEPACVAPGGEGSGGRAE